jgi:hypothetical protein
MMNHTKSYRFLDESQYIGIGRLVADRDAFLLLFEISRSPEALSLVRLCGRFQASPKLVNEVFLELADLGMALRHAGRYSATKFGKSAIDFIEEIANSYRPSPEVPRGKTDYIVLESDAVGAATNNSVRGTFSNSISAVKKSTATSKSDPQPLATDSNATAMESGQSEVKNASRSHNYL